MTVVCGTHLSAQLSEAGKLELRAPAAAGTARQEATIGEVVAMLAGNGALRVKARRTPGLAPAGSPPHPQGAQKQGAEQDDYADEQQVQQALRDHAHDAQRDRRDHQQ